MKQNAGLADDMPLSQTHIRYLLIIYRLDADCQGVRCVDIANALGLTKPTVNSMMRTLTQMGLVEQARGSAVFLTEQGRERARLCDICQRAAIRLFRTALGLSEAEATTAACALLAGLGAGRLPELSANIHAALGGIG